jgi:8-oxo-dGTP pyrophosphatase MutT (NUDIX family)
VTVVARRDFYHVPEAPQANSVVPSVVAAVRNAAGELLMIHRTDNDRWALPGGGHDIGESIAQTVVREVFEETGIVVEVTGTVGIYTDPGHVMAYDDGEVRQQFSICFTARPVGGTPTTSSESREVLWIRPEDLDTLDIHPTMRLRINHALADLPQPHIG